MKSLMSDKKVCWVCGTDQNIHKHHIYPGYANRKLSEKHGCWVYLCGRHHNLSNEGVHFNPELDTMLRTECQRKYEETHTRDEFRRIFGKSYL